MRERRPEGTALHECSGSARPESPPARRSYFFMRTTTSPALTGPFSTGETLA